MSSLAKQKRKAERAAKQASKSGTSTPRTANGSATPLSNASVEDLSAQLNGTKLNNGTTTASSAVAPDAERSAVGVLASQPESRDIKIEQFNLSFHGRVLIENATIELNYGQRYGLLGANGSGKTTFLSTLAAREVPIPDHIDVYLLKEEAEPSDMNALDYILMEAKKKVDTLEAEIEKMSMDPENMDEVALQAMYDRLEEMDPNTFEAKASSILTGLGFTNEMMRKPTSDMSGGWRMRVTLGIPSFPRSNVQAKLCSLNPFYCCWTNPPTISISKLSSGSKLTSRNIPIVSSSLPTLKISSTMFVLKSWISQSIVNSSTTVETTTPTSAPKTNSKQIKQKHTTNNKTKSPTSRNSSPVPVLMYVPSQQQLIPGKFGPSSEIETKDY
jgi:ABC-type molybdenum transport system ATPase subunit/photorepair protein PhrA